MVKFIAAFVAVALLFVANVSSQELNCADWDDGTPLARPCPRSFSPVCGSDSVTYSNDCVFCQRRRELSSRDLPLSFMHRGDCSEGGERVLPFPGVLGQQNTNRQGPQPDETENLVSPNNRDDLNQINSQLPGLLRLFARPPTSNFYDLWARRTIPRTLPPTFRSSFPRQPMCALPGQLCPKTSPVCGSDYRTYETECALCRTSEYFRSRIGRSLTVIKDGVC